MTQEVPRKQCSMCKDWKPITDFHKEKKKKLGVQSKCKFCKRTEGFLRRGKDMDYPAANGNNEQQKGGAHAQQKEEETSN